VSSRPQSVARREALEITETPYGTVGVLHAGDELRAWWIAKEHEEVDPEWTVFSRDDFLFVIRGALTLEFRDAGELVLEAGDAFVIPAGAAFRGYAWPRDADEPCVFLAVSRADVETVKAPVA